MRGHVVDVGPGPEDFEVQEDGPRGPRLLISTQDRRRRIPGHIVTLDLAAPTSEKARRMELVGRPEDRRFFPVGISQVVREDGQRWLYVIVNDHQNPPAIETYRVDGDRLHFLAPPLVDREHLTTPNDLLALPSGEIFVSNSGNTGNLLHDLFGNLLRLPLGSVVHYDGRGQWRRAVEREFFPNGLALHPDDRHLLINVFGRKQIRIFDRTAWTLLKKRIPLTAHPDNSTWERRGVLNVAAHRSMWRTGLHTVCRRFRAPSVGFEVHVGELSDTWAVETLYREPGFAASSTAVRRDKTIYVSQLMDTSLLILEPATPNP